MHRTRIAALPMVQTLKEEQMLGLEECSGSNLFLHVARFCNLVPRHRL